MAASGPSRVAASVTDSTSSGTSTVAVAANAIWLSGGAVNACGKAAAGWAVAAPEAAAKASATISREAMRSMGGRWRVEPE